MAMHQLSFNLTEEDLLQLREHYDARQPSPLKVDNPSKRELASWLVVIGMTVIDNENRERGRLQKLLADVPVTIRIEPAEKGGA